jgi:hypothetical protein
LIRTHQTTQDVRGERYQLPQLNEIDGGDFEVSCDSFSNGLCFNEIDGEDFDVSCDSFSNGLRFYEIDGGDFEFEI